MLLGREFTAVAAAVHGLVPRGDTSCPANSTSQNGLKFTNICGFDTPCPGNLSNCDIAASSSSRFYTDIQSLSDCQEICANHFNPCYGVAYDASRNNCWLKGSAVTAQLAQKNGDGYKYSSSLANRQQLATPSNVDCPAANNATVTSSTGAPYQLFCSSDIANFDLNFDSRPHASTLAQCIDYCAAASPLCEAVAWNVGQQLGWANCFLKTKLNYTITPRPVSSNLNTHFARLLPSVKAQVTSSIPSNGSYTSNNITYDVQQNVDRSGYTVLSNSHADNITACLDKCAGNSTCQGARFDWSLDDGYLNCYLLSNVGTAAGGNAHYSSAQKSTSPGGSNSGNGGSGSGSSSSDGGSKAWIAGAVIGPLVLIALIVAGVIFWRRRQKKKYEGVANTAANHPIDEKPYQPQGPYVTGEIYRHEMPESANIYEMPGSATETKGPQEMSGSIAAQELPGNVVKR